MAVLTAAMLAALATAAVLPRDASAATKPRIVSVSLVADQEFTAGTIVAGGAR